MKPTFSNIERRLVALENSGVTGGAMERPTSYMFVPFGAEVSDEWAGALEAEERARQRKPVGFLFVPYRAEPQNLIRGGGI